jgi:methylthioribose-1-phosphate isomerase
MARRTFFRQFAGDMAGTAASLVGTIAALREDSLHAAQSIFDPEAELGGDAAAAVEGEGLPDTMPGFRTPFRSAPDEPRTLLVLDQRLLPGEVREHAVRSAADAAWAIREMVIRGAPAIGQLAALGLAMTAETTAGSQPHARHSILNGAANSLRRARPTAVNLGAAVDRVMARFAEFGEANEDGAAIAAAMRQEAEQIVHEASTDHGRIATLGVEALPWPEDGRILNVLTHCNTGPLACGQFGTALGIVQVAHHRSLPIHVWVDETRPYLQGARLTAWELAAAGVAHALIPDAAAGSLIAAGDVDVVLVGADRIAANGDTANKIGTYPLAVLAARHGVPFYVVAPLSSVDPATPDGGAIPIEQRAPREVLFVGEQRIAPVGTTARNPAFDVTPADLVSAIVTEEGVLRAPFGPALAEARERRAARWAQAGPATGPTA